MTEWEPLVTLLELLSDNPRLKAVVQFLSLVVLICGFYRYLLKPSYRFHWKLFDAANKVIAAFPVVMEMAREFRPNGGNSLRDVLNRIEFKQAHMDSRVAALLQSSPTAFFEADGAGVYTWVNRAWCELTGYQAEEALGYGWLNIICQDYQSTITAQWKLAVEQRRSCVLEFDLVTKQEEVLPAKIETFALRQGTQVVGFLGRVSLLPLLEQEKPSDE